MPVTQPLFQIRLEISRRRWHFFKCSFCQYFFKCSFCQYFFNISSIFLQYFINISSELITTHFIIIAPLIDPHTWHYPFWKSDFSWWSIYRRPVGLVDVLKCSKKCFEMFFKKMFVFLSLPPCLPNIVIRCNWKILEKVIKWIRNKS